MISSPFVCFVLCLRGAVVRGLPSFGFFPAGPTYRWRLGLGFGFSILRVHRYNTHGDTKTSNQESPGKANKVGKCGTDYEEAIAATTAKCSVV